uniref:F-box domain-containing protein n=1 Tax=Physcomitrium patens TaxID=3218 RepID=A0A7I4DZS2_PHYPA
MKSRKREAATASSEQGICSSGEWRGDERGGGGGALLPGLPDEVAALVLARLPRSLLLELKRVCKSWKKALEQPFVAETRAGLPGCMEEWLYVQSWNSYTGKVAWWAFDWQVGKWLCLPTVPRRRGVSAEVFGRASAVLRGKLYVMGGKAGPCGPTLRDLFVYCPLRNKWSRRKQMISTRHSPLVCVLRGKRMDASEVYDYEKDEWAVIENTGHPTLPAPSWYKKDWRPEWQSIVLNNQSYFCSYTEEDGRAFIKEYDPETGIWKLKKHKLKALLRYGLSTVLAGKLHTVDWAAGRVRVADTSGMGWIQMKEIQNLPWVQIWRANPQMVGLGTSLFVVKRGLQIMSIDVSKVDSGQLLRFWGAPMGPGVKDEEVLSCEVLAL